MSNHKKTFYAFLILGVVLLFLRLPTLFELPSTDSTLYAYIGQQMPEGKLLYRDLWDHKPPGIFFLYQGISYLGKIHPWVIPLGDIFCAWLLLGGIMLLACRFWGLGPAVGAAFIFLLFSLSPFSQGAWSRLGAETLINLLLVLCIYCGYRGFCGQKKGAFFLSGLFLGTAFVIKFTALMLALPLILLLRTPSTDDAPAKTFRIKYLLFLLLGFSIPSISTLLYLLNKGIVTEAYEALVVFNRTYAALRVDWHSVSLRLAEKWQGQAIFPAAVLLLALLGLLRDKLYRSLPGRILMLWTLAAMVSFLIQGKYLMQHFLSLVPPLSLLASYSGEWLKKKGEEKNSAAVSLLVVVLFAGAAFNAFYGYLGYYRPGFTFMLKKTSYEEALRSLPVNEKKLGLWELGRLLNQNSQEKDYIYVWAMASEIYYYAERPAPNRFLLAHYLLDAKNPLSHGLPGVNLRQQELLRNLREKPVKFIIVGLKDPTIHERRDSLSLLEDFSELNRWITDNYFLAASNEHFLLFQKNPGNN